jgi:hypothetical protein
VVRYIDELKELLSEIKVQVSLGIKIKVRLS